MLKITNKVHLKMKKSRKVVKFKKKNNKKYN